MARPFDITASLFESATAEKGIIRGVKIIGHVSKNGGRRYTESALQKAIGLYEGTGIYLNHHKTDGDRDVRDKLGHLENVTARPDGLYGDIRYFETHAFAPTLQEAAANKKLANDIGLSHNADAKVTRKGGKQVVESIEAVHSVDLVSDPATVRGLFESVEASYAEDPQSPQLNPNKTVSEVIFDILTSDDEEDAKLERIRSLLAAMNSSKPTNETPDEDAGQDPKTMTSKESVAMTPEEKQAFEELKESVKKQGESITASAAELASLKEGRATDAIKIKLFEAGLTPTDAILESLKGKEAAEQDAEITRLKEGVEKPGKPPVGSAAPSTGPLKFEGRLAKLAS